MYFQYRNGKLIQDNIRLDEQNKKFWDDKEYNKVFTEWRDGDILYIGDAPLSYPIEDNGKMREMTEEELKEVGIITEPVETKEQLMEQKINYILEYSKLEENKKVVESSKFSTEDEIKAITEKMAILEGHINVLTEKIKAL
ncbi:hypothetical protein [Fusobacterium ulcerans]|uniref:hypothetical protein n=1 Tax=Fusobacterium ulcerans TaxID=861 RepID=UPI001D0B5340|nr:hypothetical protein [Fusobacterium ulcerans]MCB8564939.1 hypothetical protein [Fusobacterium ulcerans]MCB8649794.1 hypothetical protein [Fusobacterium ulcerans]